MFQGKITQDSPTLLRLVDEYSVVIQEFFQKRVEIWLETVGKKILRIKHYWGRFEFTPARMDLFFLSRVNYYVIPIVIL
jgi:hypothetical protein